MITSKNRRSRWGIAIAIASTLGMSVAAVGSASENRPPPDSGPVTTTPSSESPVANGSPLDDPEVQMYAKEMGWTAEKALEVLDGQAELTTFAQSIIDEKEYVEFRGNPNTATGELMVEPGLGQTQTIASVRVPSDIEVIEAAAPRREREALLREITDLAADTGGDNFGAVSYDPFENSYTVSVRDQSRDSALTATDLMDATSGSRAATGATIEVVEVLDANFRGGQLEWWWDGSTWLQACTSGFGVSSSMGTGYLTAGHCGTGWWWVNGGMTNTIGDRQWGGYDDHQVIQRPGASWLVRISPNLAEVDMSSSAQHVFVGTRYCNYGQFSNQLYCGDALVSNVHVGGPGDPIVLGTQTDSWCRPGDSGGPVWKPGSTRLPAGLIDGGDTTVPPVNGNWNCIYVALDDQLAGGGWSLL